MKIASFFSFFQAVFKSQTHRACYGIGYHGSRGASGVVAAEVVSLARGQQFGRVKRLSGRKAFARVFGGRCSSADRNLVVFALPNGLPYSRLGLTVGRKCGRAVVRNRIKRLLREAFRLEGDALPKGYDLVCLPRPGRAETLEAYRRSLRSLSVRASKRCRRKDDA